MQKRAAIGKGRAARAKRLLRNVLDPPSDKRKRRQRRGETYAKARGDWRAKARPEQSDYCKMFSTRRVTSKSNNKLIHCNKLGI